MAGTFGETGRNARCSHGHNDLCGVHSLLMLSRKKTRKTARGDVRRSSMWNVHRVKHTDEGPMYTPTLRPRTTAESSSQTSGQTPQEIQQTQCHPESKVQSDEPTSPTSTSATNRHCPPFPSRRGRHHIFGGCDLLRFLQRQSMKPTSPQVCPERGGE